MRSSSCRAGAQVAQVLVVAMMAGLFFMGTLYLERILDMNPIEIGFAE